MKLTEFKLLPHGFLNYDIIPFMAEECGKAIFWIALCMKEELKAFSNDFLEPHIEEIDSDEDLMDSLLERLGVNTS